MKTLLNLTLICSAATLHAQPIEKGFTKIFNDKDLTGWKIINGTASYEVKNGEIIGTTAKGSPNTFLATKKHYANFDLRYQVKIDHDELNSGCQIRSNQSQDYRGGIVHGYQVETEALNGATGFIYDESRRGWLSKNRKNPTKNNAFKKGKWNKLRIVADGKRIQTWVNGIAVEDLNDDLTSSGFIGLQVHSVYGDPKWSVRWKNIRIKELPSKTEKKNKKSDFITTGNWKFKPNGEITLNPRKGETDWKRYDDYLWLKKAQANFVCTFEYKHEKGGNSGFYFRVKDKKNPVFTGIETQILDSHSKKEQLTEHDCGGIIFTRPAAKNTAKPAGQWNKMIVRCEHNHLKVWLNSEKIQDMYLDKTKMKDRPKKGYIGFQDHGLPFTLRNITLESL